MIKNIIFQWEKNKYKLEEYFKTTKQTEYSKYTLIVEKIFELCIDGFDTGAMTVIDDGHYEGTQIFIIPRKVYQPDMSDYVVTNTYYGSCGGCDTLEGIRDDSDNYNGNDIPSASQVKQYMLLSLHLVQKLKWLSKEPMFTVCKYEIADMINRSGFTGEPIEMVRTYVKEKYAEAKDIELDIFDMQFTGTGEPLYYVFKRNETEE